MFGLGIGVLIMLFEKVRDIFGWRVWYVGLIVKIGLMNVELFFMMDDDSDIVIFKFWVMRNELFMFIV